MLGRNIMEFLYGNMSKGRIDFLSMKITIVWDTAIGRIIEIQDRSSQKGMNDI